MATIGFTGGQALEQRLRELSRKAKESVQLEVGFFQGATYPDGESVPSVAAQNEFGVPSNNQPPRPFFRNMIAKNSGGWGNAVAVQLKRNDYDSVKALDIVGVGIADQLKQSIIDLVSPPLSPVTIARKGFDKPLIDTSQMENSIGSETTVIK